MNQQLNFYQAEFCSREQLFGAMTVLKLCGVLVLAMVLTSTLAARKVRSSESEFQTIILQEKAAVERLEKLQPLLGADGGSQTWAARLEKATNSLEQKKLVLSLVQGSTLGDTKGFSRYLKSLARQDTNELWLTQIDLSALGDRTRLEGKSLRAELVPAYLQNLAEEPPFAQQRFHQFQINGAEGFRGGVVTFSMDNAGLEKKQ